MPSSFGRLSPMNFHCIDGSHLPVLVLITCLFGLAGLFAYLLPWVFFLSLSLSLCFAFSVLYFASLPTYLRALIRPLEKSLARRIQRGIYTHISEFGGLASLSCSLCLVVGSISMLVPNRRELALGLNL